MILLLCLLAAGPAPKGGLVLLGRQDAQYRVEIADPRFIIPTYQNNGYRQRTEQKNGEIRVRVEITNNQVASKLRARVLKGLPIQFQPLADRINAITSEGFLADQVAVMIDWLHTHIQYEQEFVADQSPNKVLETHRANCVGFTNVALDVLEKLGLEARIVTGIAFQNNDSVRMDLEGYVLHRWLEVHYPDVGWVFCDASGKANFVPATYLVLGVEGVHDREAVLSHAVDSRIELLKLNNGLRLAGSIPHFGKGLQLRPNRLFVMEK